MKNTTVWLIASEIHCMNPITDKKQSSQSQVAVVLAASDSTIVSVSRIACVIISLNQTASVVLRQVDKSTFISIGLV